MPSPPVQHRVKQYQRFFSRLTTKALGLSPPWRGHTRSDEPGPLLAKLGGDVVHGEHLQDGDRTLETPEVEMRRDLQRVERLLPS